MIPYLIIANGYLFGIGVIIGVVIMPFVIYIIGYIYAIVSDIIPICLEKIKTLKANAKRNDIYEPPKH